MLVCVKTARTNVCWDTRRPNCIQNANVIQRGITVFKISCAHLAKWDEREREWYVWPPSIIFRETTRTKCFAHYVKNFAPLFLKKKTPKRSVPCKRTIPRGEIMQIKQFKNAVVCEHLNICTRLDVPIKLPRKVTSRQKDECSLLRTIWVSGGWKRADVQPPTRYGHRVWEDRRMKKETLGRPTLTSLGLAISRERIEFGLDSGAWWTCDHHRPTPNGITAAVCSHHKYLAASVSTHHSRFSSFLARVRRQR